MSRIGRMPVTVPSGVDVTINGREVTVKGPKGTLSLEVAAPIEVGQVRRHASPSPGPATRARSARCTGCPAR